MIDSSGAGGLKRFDGSGLGTPTACKQWKTLAQSHVTYRKVEPEQRGAFIYTLLEG